MADERKEPETVSEEDLDKVAGGVRATIVADADTQQASGDTPNGNDLDIQIRTRGRTGH